MQLGLFCSKRLISILLVTSFQHKILTCILTVLLVLFFLQTKLFNSAFLYDAIEYSFFVFGRNATISSFSSNRERKKNTRGIENHGNEGTDAAFCFTLFSYFLGFCILHFMVLSTVFYFTCSYFYYHWCLLYYKCSSI